MSFKLKFKKNKIVSLIWVLPLIALCCAGSLIYKTHIDKGPQITLVLKNAEGLVAGKTLIKSLSVDVGKVTSISLSEDLKSVIAQVQMNKNTENLLNEKTVFFVQKARIDKQGVSGLNTLLSGIFIDLVPGVIDEKDKNNDLYLKEYKVLEEPPIIIGGKDLYLTLFSEGEKVLSIGDLIKFKGIEAGVVVSKSYDKELNKVKYSVIIRDEFAHLVNDKTSFWINSGLSIEMGGSGFKFNTDSIDNIIVSGISFDNIIDYNEIKKPAKNGDEYTLFSNRNSIVAQYKYTMDYMVVTQNLPNTLDQNTPVFFHGIQIGRVKKSPYYSSSFELFKDKKDFYAFLITIELDRFNHVTKENIEALKNQIKNYLINNNVIAHIDTVNFLTGSLAINLVENDVNFNLKMKDLIADANDGYDLIYADSSDFSKAKNNLIEFTNNLKNLDFNLLVKNVNTLLQSSKNTSDSISTLSKNLNVFVEDLHKNNTSQEMVATLQKIQEILVSYNSSSQMYSELQDTINNLNNTLKNIEPIVEKVDENSNSLIFNYEKEDPKPLKK